MIYKGIFLPVLLHISENWTILEKYISRIIVAEMIFLRTIVGKTKRDYKRNEIVSDESVIVSVEAKIEERQLRWLGHVRRMRESCKTKWSMEAKLKDKGL